MRNGAGPVNVARILARWDAIAHSQLCDAAARMAVENETLAERAYHAENDAESWREDAMRALERDGRPGITRDGHLVGFAT